MIRQANKYDKADILDMMKMFRKESHIQEYQDLDNEEYWDALLDHILAGKGVIFIEQNKGLLMGLICQIPWCDKTLQMYELAWYVKPEYRNTTIGYKLLKNYVEYGKKLKENGRIKLFTMSKMITSPNIKYDRFGFRKLDETWIQ